MAATTATTTPTAQATPNDRVEGMRAAAKVTKLSATVAPEAVMAGTEPRHAAAIATRRSACWRNSSR